MIDMPERPRLDMWKFAAIIVVIVVAGFAAFKFGWSSAVTVEPGMLTVETTPAGSQVCVDGEAERQDAADDSRERGQARAAS